MYIKEYDKTKRAEKFAIFLIAKFRSKCCVYGSTFCQSDFFKSFQFISGIQDLI